MVSIVSLVAAVFLGCSERPGNMRPSLDPKFQEVSALPVGLQVTHSPNPVKAQLGGRSGNRYTWVFKTSVWTVGEPVTITEFGAFAWHKGRWVSATFTGKPFTPEDFADWYSCPGAKIAGDTYSDPANWGGDSVLRDGKALWYFVGTTPDGKKVKGEAIIEKLSQIE